MYPKATGYFCNLSSFLCCKSYCFFLKLLIVLPIHLSLLHFTPPKVLRLYYNLTLRCVHYFGGSARFRLYNAVPRFAYLEDITSPCSVIFIRPLTVPRG